MFCHLINLIKHFNKLLLLYVQLIQHSIIHVELCFCLLVDASFCLWFSLHQILREISDCLAAKCPTVFTYCVLTLLTLSFCCLVQGWCIATVFSSEIYC